MGVNDLKKILFINESDYICIQCLLRRSVLLYLKKKLVFIISLIVMCGVLLSDSSFASDQNNFFDDVRYELVENLKGDIVNYYSFDTLKLYAASFAIGGIFANTSLDQSIHDEYQDNWRSDGTDDFSEIVKDFGEGDILIPLSLAAAAVGYLMPEDSGFKGIGTWGGNTARAYLVGAPSMLLMQVVTGASRPDETSDESKWKPFSDNNGVSGHSFMGAVPFITLAKMYQDSPVKWLFYGASVLTGWSRINDGDHYFSQSALGWIMAYQSVTSVFRTDEQRQSQLSLTVFPYSKGGAGAMVSYTW